MNQNKSGNLVAIFVLTFLTSLALAYSGGDETFKEVQRTVGSGKTIFVVEMIRHGARAHYESNVDSEEFFGVPKGHLTERGGEESAKIGI